MEHSSTKELDLRREGKDPKVVTGEVSGETWSPFRGDSVTPSDFTMVACYDNEKTVDGCYSDQELSVPDPSSMMSEMSSLD